MTRNSQTTSAKILKPDLEDDQPFEPYKLYRDLFQKKGHSRHTIYKMYTLVGC